MDRVATYRTTGRLHAGSSPASAQVSGYHAAFQFGALIAAAGALAAVVDLHGLSPKTPAAPRQHYTAKPPPALLRTPPAQP